MSAYYAQTIAEELCVRPETISLVLGDTDRTPDGGASANLLDGMANVRKVAAYTHQALLGLAATQLVFRLQAYRRRCHRLGRGKSISYGQLVQGQQLDLKIPVAGMAREGRSVLARSNGLADSTGSP